MENWETHTLRIRHRTVYSYLFPVAFAPHRLVLRPREGPDLRVEAMTLTITPASSRVWTRDIFGNSVAHVHFSGSANELVIDSEVTVRRFFDPASPPLLEQGASPYPFTYDALEQGIMTGYLTPLYPEDRADMQSWISTLPAPGSFRSAEAFAVRLAEIIHQRIAYQRREQKGVQNPAGTLALGSGSCRDVATLMMETLRHLGIAARFVSGYLDCPDPRAARGSTHAWVEVYFPSLGWRGFDATTGRACDHHHVVIGASHHPRGVMPITGHFIGATNAFQSMSVSVEFSEPLPIAADGQQQQQQ